MSNSKETVNGLSKDTVTRLAHEWNEVAKSGCEKYAAVRVGMEPKDISIWYGLVVGPKDTAFYGMVFCVKLGIPSNYPHSPPSATFIPVVTHPNISNNGICVNVLKNEAWSTTSKLLTIFQQLNYLLNDGNPESALSGGCSEIYRKYIDLTKKSAPWSDIQKCEYRKKLVEEWIKHFIDGKYDILFREDLWKRKNHF